MADDATKEGQSIPTKGDSPVSGVGKPPEAIAAVQGKGKGGKGAGTKRGGRKQTITVHLEARDVTFLHFQDPEIELMARDVEAVVRRKTRFDIAVTVFMTLALERVVNKESDLPDWANAILWGALVVALGLTIVFGLERYTKKKTTVRDVMDDHIKRITKEPDPPEQPEAEV